MLLLHRYAQLGEDVDFDQRVRMAMPTDRTGALKCNLFGYTRASSGNDQGAGREATGFASKLIHSAASFFGFDGSSSDTKPLKQVNVTGTYPLLNDIHGWAWQKVRSEHHDDVKMTFKTNGEVDFEDVRAMEDKVVERIGVQEVSISVATAATAPSDVPAASVSDNTLTLSIRVPTARSMELQRELFEAFGTPKTASTFFDFTVTEAPKVALLPLFPCKDTRFLFTRITELHRQRTISNGVFLWLSEEDLPSWKSETEKELTFNAAFDLFEGNLEKSGLLLISRADLPEHLRSYTCLETIRFPNLPWRDGEETEYCLIEVPPRQDEVPQKNKKKRRRRRELESNDEDEDEGDEDDERDDGDEDEHDEDNNAHDAQVDSKKGLDGLCRRSQHVDDVSDVNALTGFDFSTSTFTWLEEFKKDGKQSIDGYCKAKIDHARRQEEELKKQGSSKSRSDAVKVWKMAVSAWKLAKEARMKEAKLLQEAICHPAQVRRESTRSSRRIGP